MRRWGPRSLDTMRRFLGGHVVLPYDTRVAARWGELQAYAQLRGCPRPANDRIAACCLVRDVPLATLNIKDFAIKGDPHARISHPPRPQPPSLAGASQASEIAVPVTVSARAASGAGAGPSTTEPSATA